MNPDTGQFYPVDNSGKKKGSVTENYAKEKGWPIFSIGQIVNIEGYPFKILHIKPSIGRMILQPIPRPNP